MLSTSRSLFLVLVSRCQEKTKLQKEYSSWEAYRKWKVAVQRCGKITCEKTDYKSDLCKDDIVQRHNDVNKYLQKGKK